MKIILLSTAAAAIAAAAPLRHAGADVNATVLRVSENTVELRLAAPLDQTVLIQYPSEQKWSGRELAKPVEVATGKYTFTLAASPLSLTVRRKGGGIVQQLTWNESDDALTFQTKALVFGLGEGGPGYDRRGQLLPLADGWGAYERKYYGSRISVPLAIGADGWALFLADLPGQKGEFDLRDKSTGIYRAGGDAAARAHRVFLIAADDPIQILAEYAKLTGKAPLPPKWTMGFMQSHRTLAGPEEVLGIAKTYREKRLPCDALIYLGTGYCPAGWNNGHGSIEFNPKTFDNPKQNIRNLQDLNFKVVLHVNRAPRDLHGKSIAETSDHSNHIRNYWARHAGALEAGADAWWPDDGDELPQEARIARHRAYYEGSLLSRPNLRPWALHRTGYAGVQRYGGWIWTGDPGSYWATLAAHVPIGLNHSVSLTPFWGSDIGGFFPTPELTGELYVRWFQFGAFCSSFRAHGRTWKLRLPWGWNTGEYGPIEHQESPDPSELRNAAVEPITREYLHLRYRLLPYNYTLAREAHDTAIPMMRPLWLYYGSDAKAVEQGTEYLWGRDMLIAPVVEKGAVERSVYLPAGDWYDWWTNEKHAGGQSIVRKVDLKTMPIFVRAGAIIPLDPVRQYTAEPVNEPSTIQVYAGANGEFILYDDDGSSMEYAKGQGTWTRLTWDNGSRRLRIAADPRTKAPAAKRTFKVRLMPAGTEKQVEFTGRAAEVRF